MYKISLGMDVEWVNDQGSFNGMLWWRARGDDVDNFHATKLDQKNEADFMLKLGKSTVVVHSKLLNIMWLKFLVQVRCRDEPVKSFMASLKSVVDLRYAVCQ